MIYLREPSLTGDNLGHKTWVASYLLARRLALFCLVAQASEISTTPSLASSNIRNILELGSGTGLLGIAAATLFHKTKLRLTDLEPILPNLQVNVESNSHLFQEGNKPTVDLLDWSLEPDTQPTTCGESYDLVLAADPLYSDKHPEWLVNAICNHLSSLDNARVVVELPLREAYMPQVLEFRNRMIDQGFALLDDGTETGTEDWENGQDGCQVTCWWGVWGWST